MIINAIVWLYASIIFYLLGSFLLSVIEKITKNEMISNPFLIIFTGLGLLTAILQIYSIFARIWVETTVIITIASILSIFLNSDKFKKRLKLSYEELIFTLKNPILLFIAACSFMYLLQLSSMQPRNFDSYLYHIQNIQWLERYGTVPGLGFVHSRLSFGSSWLIIETFFAFSYMFNTPLHAIHNFIIFLLIMFLIDWSRTRDCKIVKFTVFKKSFAIVMVVIIQIFNRGLLRYQNTGTDFAANMLFILIIILWINSFLEKKQQNTYFTLIVFISAVAVTYKTSMTTIIIFSFYILLYILMTKRTAKYKLNVLLLIVVLGIFVSIPYLIRHIIQSGYLIFPFYKIDIFNFDWKLPIEEAISNSMWVTSWARKPGPMIADYTFLQWFPIWWNETIGIKKQILYSILILLFLFINMYEIFRIVTRRYRSIREYMIIVPLSIFLIVSFLFWFFMAPDYRFSFSMIHSILVFSISIIVYSFIASFDNIKNILVKVLDKIKNIFHIMVKAYFYFILILSIGFIVLIILGNKERIAYINNFEADKKIEGLYESRLKFNSKVFRNSDIYSVVPVLDNIYDIDNLITNISYNKNMARLEFEFIDGIENDFYVEMPYKLIIKYHKVKFFPNVLFLFLIILITLFLKYKKYELKKYIISSFICYVIILTLSNGISLFVISEPYKSSPYKIIYHKNIGQYYKHTTGQGNYNQLPSTEYIIPDDVYFRGDSYKDGFKKQEIVQ